MDRLRLQIVLRPHGERAYLVPRRKAHENVFDAFPDLNMIRNANGQFTPQANFGIFTYPSQSPFGMNGRFVYTRLGVTF